MKEKKQQMRCILILVCLFWFGQYVYIPYQTTYLTGIGVPAGITGIIIGAYGFVQIICRIPVGMMADMGGGHKKIITMGICCVGIASLIRVLFPNAAGFLSANLISGLGASAWISYMVYYMGFYGPDSLQAATGKIIAANNAGVLIGFVTSSVLYTHVGMRWICGFSLLAGGIGTLLSLRVKDHSDTKEKVSRRELIPLFTKKRLLFFSILALLQQGVQMATCMSFTVQVMDDMGAADWQEGASSIVYIVFAVFFSYLSSKKVFSGIGHCRIVPVGLLVQALYCVLVPNMTEAWEIWLCQVLAAFAMGFLFTSLTSESMEEIPKQYYSTAMGIFQAVYAVGMTLFPVIVGKLKEYFSIQAGFYFMAVILLAGLCFSIIYYRKDGSRLDRYK